MTSVARILPYTELEQEAPAHIEGDEPLPELWPRSGQITFDHVTVSYSKDVQYALKDICFTIQAGEKVSMVAMEIRSRPTFRPYAFVTFRIHCLLFIDRCSGSHRCRKEFPDSMYAETSRT